MSIITIRQMFFQIIKANATHFTPISKTWLTGREFSNLCCGKCVAMTPIEKKVGQLNTTK